MSSVGVKTRNRVKVVPRLEVLSTTVKEFLKAFGASDSCLGTVDKGVYQEQIIKTFHLYYFSGDNLCGKITMNIDWDKHQVCVNSDTGKEFSINEGESLIEQLDKASKLIVRHVNKMRTELNVKRIEVQYSYRDYYTSDPTRYDLARKRLGHSPANSISDSSTSEFKTEVRLIMDRLKELEIIVEN